MGKTISVVMCENGCIEIKLNGDVKITIDQQNRSISAEDIYKALEFVPGNQYTVESQNPSDTNGPVLRFFCDLLENIAEKVNAISDSPDN